MTVLLNQRRDNFARYFLRLLNKQIFTTSPLLEGLLSLFINCSGGNYIENVIISLAFIGC